MLKTMLMTMLVFIGTIGTTENEIELLPGAKFNWDYQMVDLGEINQGQAVSALFSFENDGDQALLITGAKASCGCTVASYTKEAIEPGKKGEVKVVYDAKNEGAFQKSVILTANTETGSVQLIIKGVVKGER
jgi:hypothetical protein